METSYASKSVGENEPAGGSSLHSKAQKKKEDAIEVEILKKAHAERADIKATLARQSFRIRRAKSEPERDLALEQAAQLLKEIELGSMIEHHCCKHA